MTSRKSGKNAGRLVLKSWLPDRVPLQYLFTALIVFLLDFATKTIVRTKGVSTEGFISIMPTTNSGSLFSLFAGVPAVNLIFIIVSILAIALVTYFVSQESLIKDVKSMLIGFGLILGGIVGNLLDRIIVGSVFDWIDCTVWPVFNLADAGIVLGVCLVLYSMIMMELSEKKKKISSKKG